MAPADVPEKLVYVATAKVQTFGTNKTRSKRRIIETITVIKLTCVSL